MKFLTEHQQFSMVFVYFCGTVTALCGNSAAGRDGFLACLAASIFILFLVFIFNFPGCRYKEFNFFQLTKKLYGKRLGKVIIALYAALAIFFASSTLGIFSSFIKTVSVNHISLYVTAFVMIAVGCYIGTKGILHQASFSEIICYFVIIMLAFSIIMSLKSVDMANLQPVIFDGIYPVLYGSFEILSIIFLEVFFLIALMQGYRKKNDNKPINLAIIWAGIFIAAIFMRNIALLGYPAIRNYYYPSYSAVSLISLGDFFGRQEVLVSIGFLLCDLFKISIMINFCIEAVESLLDRKINYNSSTFIIGFIIYALSVNIFKGTIDVFWVLGSYKYFMFIPFIVIPITTMLISLKKPVNLDANPQNNIK